VCMRPKASRKRWNCKPSAPDFLRSSVSVVSPLAGRSSAPTPISYHKSPLGMRAAEVRANGRTISVVNVRLLAVSILVSILGIEKAALAFETFTVQHRKPLIWVNLSQSPAIPDSILLEELGRAISSRTDLEVVESPNTTLDSDSLTRCDGDFA